MAQSKQILISILEQKPQILTKVLYALLIGKKIPISEIWVITTSEGKKAALTQLLNSGKGYLYKFYQDYGIDVDSIQFGSNKVIIPGDVENESHENRNLKKTDQFKEVIFDFIREKTNERGTTLHCSLAGTQKALNIYLAFALQFFGRPSDRLYNVLVNPPEIENNQEFYYIPPIPKVFRTPSGQIVSTANAQIKLEEIDFVKLRAKFEYLFGSAALTFYEMVKLTQQELEQMPNLPPLIVDRANRKLCIRDKSIFLTPIEFSIYRYYLERSKFRAESIPVKEYGRYFEGADGFYFSQEGTKQLMKIYREYVSNYMFDEFQASLEKGALPFERACQYFSRIKRKIRKALNDEKISEYYIISGVGRYRKKYGIKLDKTKVIMR